MKAIALKVIDKSGIFKKTGDKLEAVCYALLWSSMFLCLAEMF